MSYKSKESPFIIKRPNCSYKIDTNCGNVRFRVSIIRKSEKQTRLSDTGVSNKEQFEEIIAVVQAGIRASREGIEEAS